MSHAWAIINREMEEKTGQIYNFISRYVIYGRKKPLLSSILLSIIIHLAGIIDALDS